MIYHEDTVLGNRIAETVWSEYESPKGLTVKQKKQLCNAKPKESEFTVVAGIVALQDAQDAEGRKRRKIDTCKVISMATGLKAVPSERIEKTGKGQIVHDMHAEVLSTRLLNLAILEDVERIRDGQEGQLLEKSGDLFKLKDNTELAMYVSEIPCGDASQDNVKEASSDQTEWKDNSRDGILRGRAFFGQVGRVRTKPGRRDSPITYSKSCSDKLCLKQVTTLLNSITYDLIDPENRDRFKLRYLALPKKLIKQKAIERCFSRVEGPLQVIPTTVTSNYTVGSGKPAQLSIAYRPGHLEILSKGLRNGAPKKIKPINVSDLSRSKMVSRLKQVSEIKASDYNSFKASSALAPVKNAAKKNLGWPRSTVDNFSIIESAQL